MSWRERKRREREKNAIYSGHLRLCQQPRAAHALRSDQLLWIVFSVAAHEPAPDTKVLVLKFNLMLIYYSTKFNVSVDVCHFF